MRLLLLLVFPCFAACATTSSVAVAPNGTVYVASGDTLYSCSESAGKVTCFKTSLPK